MGLCFSATSAELPACGRPPRFFRRCRRSCNFAASAPNPSSWPSLPQVRKRIACRWMSIFFRQRAPGSIPNVHKEGVAGAGFFRPDAGRAVHYGWAWFAPKFGRQVNACIILDDAHLSPSCPKEPALQFFSSIKRLTRSFPCRTLLPGLPDYTKPYLVVVSIRLWYARMPRTR